MSEERPSMTCEEFARLLDDDACGTTDSEAQERRCREHARECASCRRLMELEDLVDFDSGATPCLALTAAQERAALDRILATAAPRRAVWRAALMRFLRAFGAKPLWLTAATAAALIAVVISILVAGLPRRGEPAFMVKVLLCEGSACVTPAGQSTGSGDDLGSDDGRLVLTLAGYRALVSRGARLRDETGVEPRLHLERGELLVDRSAEGTAPLSIVTPQGEIAVTGTRFVVISHEQTTAVAVLRGSVRVRSITGEEASVTAHGRCTLDGGAPHVASAPDEQTMDAGAARLLELCGEAGSGSGTLRVSTRPAGAVVLIDGVEAGRAPLSIQLRAGSHEVGVASVGFAHAARSVVMRAGAAEELRLSLRRESPRDSNAGAGHAERPANAPTADREQQAAGLTLRARSSVPAPRPTPLAPTGERVDPDQGSTRTRPSSDNEPTLSELVALARERRLAHDWRGAQAAYRRLLDRSPTTAEGQSALISLGQLSLESLQAPAEALTWFSAYLERFPNGTLAEEASYGRALALRQLGDSRREQEALQEFLRRFPSAIFAPQARDRMHELEVQR